MELKQLEYFMTLCQELHFTRAAEKLGIAQPSLSLQIQLLEHEIGTPLFDRAGKKTAITDAGKILLSHCYNIFHELEQAKAGIDDLKGLQRGELKVGALLTVVNYLLPSAVAVFHQDYPNIKLSIFGLRTGDILTGLFKNELDLGIVYLPVEHQGLEILHLFKQELAFAVPYNHSLAEKSSLELKVLETIPSILLPENYYLRKFINQHVMKLGFSVKPSIEMTTMESIINMVAQGLGITILPQGYLNHIKNDKIRIISIAGPSLSIQLGIVFRKNKHLSAASRAFIELLTETIKWL